MSARSFTLNKRRQGNITVERTHVVGEVNDHIQVILHNKELQTKKARVLSPGMIIDVYGITYQVVEKREKSWRVKNLTDGIIYKMGPKHMSAWKEVTKLEQLIQGIDNEA